MPDTLNIRFYNVHFGDAILVRVPDRDPADGSVTDRHLLIDVGNVLQGKPNPDGQGGDDAVFEAVVADILQQLDGRPLDLYVMTHEHLDHVQGLFFAAARHYEPGELQRRLATRSAWLTASAALDYGQRFPRAEMQRMTLRAAFRQIEAHVRTLAPAAQQQFASLLANNNPRSTAQCVDYLRTLAPAEHTHYVARGTPTDGKHPFKEARFEIWAPEEDTSRYYRSLLPMALAAQAGVSGRPAAAPLPPPGVDAGAFYDLVQSRASGFVENLLAIDKAANDTSLVFCIHWRGKKLLFAGDAELRSWRMMEEQGVLEAVDFLKVSHHGSHNGTPSGTAFDAILPPGRAGCRAAISSWEKTYSGIPHGATNSRLSERCTLETMLSDPRRGFFDVTIEA